MSTRLSALSLASIAVLGLAVPAQDDALKPVVQLDLSPATVADDGSLMIFVGDVVTLSARTSIAPTELHIYAFAPAMNMADLDLNSMVIVHQEFLFKAGGVSLDFEIPADAAGLGVSLLAVSFDEKGLAHGSNLITAFVGEDKSGG